MTFSTSRLGYSDAYDLMDKALADAKGIRFKVHDHARALYLRHRINHARGIDREDNRRTYEEGNPLHGRSIYDTLLVRITEAGDGRVWVNIEKVDAIDYSIESLSGAAE